MTLEYLKDLLFDALNEYQSLPLADLRWNKQEETFELTLEDGSHFGLALKEEKR